MKKTTLLKPFDEAEALILERLLYDNDIFAEVISYHDTAYGSLYQTQKGWGELNVDDKNLLRAKEIISIWKESSPENLNWENTEYYDSTQEDKRTKGTQPYSISSMIILMLLVLSIVLNIYFFIINTTDSFESEPLHQTQYDNDGNIVAKYDYVVDQLFPQKIRMYDKNGTEQSINYDVTTYTYHDVTN